MYKMILGTFIFVFLLTSCVSEDIESMEPIFEDDISEEEYCIAMEGTWREFPNACADTCSSQRESDVMCAQVITESCDCGEGMCWTGTTCVPI